MTDEPTRDWTALLTDRERKEQQFAQVYASDFAHGTTGHNQLMLIAHLSEMLTRVQESGVDIQQLYHPQ